MLSWSWREKERGCSHEGTYQTHHITQRWEQREEGKVFHQVNVSKGNTETNKDKHHINLRVKEKNKNKEQISRPYVPPRLNISTFDDYVF